MTDERVTDLIAELREMADMGMESAVLREAADEIERLRAGLETIANGYATTKIVTAPDGDPSIVLIEHDEFARKILGGVNDDR